MNVLITGATGMIGSALGAYFAAAGHSVFAISRRPERVPMPLQAVRSVSQLDPATRYDVVINLAGEPIADKRWSEQQKRRIVDSRLQVTRSLIDFLQSQPVKPALFISASAIGFYGIAKSGEATDHAVDETGSGDDSFPSQLCQQWEAIALQAQSKGIRTCVLRIGIVLARNGGALGKMLPPFRWGLGGAIGSGRQWMPWIHLDDLVGLVQLCIDCEDLRGVINATAPNPVTNAEFTRTLAAVLHRPAVLPMPATVVRLLFGEMGEALLLTGKRVLPVQAIRHGYHFQYANLQAALLQLLRPVN